MLALGARMRSRGRFALGKHLIYHTVSLLTQRRRGHFYERQEEECVVIHFGKIVSQLSLFALVDVLVGRWSS